MINTEEWRKKIVENLKTVYDPEIPINIVDLGLIYELKIGEEGDVYIKIGATSPFCPVVDYLLLAVEEVIKEAVKPRSLKVDLDLQTTWTPLMMTEEGRKMFKERFGYDILEVYKERQ
jgi:metal-sulfur cluster biosynthetic enzyme